MPTNRIYIDAYKIMLTSRCLDEKMMILLKQGHSFFHIGCMGHEAIQAAAGLNLIKKKDWLFPYYRDLAFCLSLGFTPKDALLGFLGRSEDPSSGGRQMPQHYGHKAYNIPTSSSSTGTQFLQSVGNAFASMREGKKDVTVVCTGDGTTSQGDFHEALSWATREKAPVVFLVENNGYAISVPLKEQRPGASVIKLASGYEGLEKFKVDGCDFEKSYAVMQKAVKHVRSGHGPVYVDASVVRLLPHSSSDDQKKYRPTKELEADKKRDPVLALRKKLVSKKILTEDKIQILETKIKKEVDLIADDCLRMSHPDKLSAEKHVYSEKKLEKNIKLSKLESEPTVIVDAINRALHEEMAHNQKMLVFGEDVAHGKGGVFTATRNLTKKFGVERCFNSPLAESSIVGIGIGLAMRQFKPVVEIQFGDYIWTAMMQIRNEVATVRYRSNNMFACPMVIRVPIGGYIHGGLCHSQNIESFFAHIPGLRVVMPSNALDAYGMLKSAIRCDDPVLFLEHKSLYRQNFAKSHLPETKDKNYLGDLEKAQIVREGRDISIITYGAMVYKALDAARELAKKNIDCEILDLRTMRPIDWASIEQSLKKTSKALVLYEDNRFMGFGSEIAAEMSEKYFDLLDAPVTRVAGADTHIPYSPTLEEEVLPQVKDVVKKVLQLISY